MNAGYKFLAEFVAISLFWLIVSGYGLTHIDLQTWSMWGMALLIAVVWIKILALEKKPVMPAPQMDDPSAEESACRTPTVLRVLPELPPEQAETSVPCPQDAVKRYPAATYPCLLAEAISPYVPPLGNFSKPNKIVILDSVLNRIFWDVGHCQQELPEHETGGAFAGRVTPGWQELCIECLLEPGTDVRREFAFFQEDRNYQTRELKRFQCLDQRVSYLGDWHRHPAAMRHPSGGDLGTDRTNVEVSFPKGQQGGFVYAIVSQATGQVDRHSPFCAGAWQIDFYYMPAECLEYHAFQPQVVHGNMLPQSWDTDNTKRVKSEIVAVTALAEMVKLQTVYDVKGKRFLCIDVQMDKNNAETISFFVAEDYPHRKPGVLKHQSGRNPQEFCDSPILNDWKPMYTLVNVLHTIF